MEKAHEELWRQIRDFPLDDPEADLTFTQRLARENGWDQDRARRVVEEYRKFMFLAVAAGQTVTPSDAVDQAWHHHMTYTRSYWDRFCREALGRRVHHEPTRGGLDEGRNFEARYEETLASYRACFGTEPPPDLWPERRERFGPDTLWERVNLRRNVVVSKARLLAAVALTAAALGALVLILFRGFVFSAFAAAMNRPGPEFLGLYGVAVGAVVLGGLAFRWRQRKPDDDPTAEELDLHAYEVAYLAGGEWRAIQAALAALVDRGVLEAMNYVGRIARKEPPGEDAHPLEQALVRAAETYGSEPRDLRPGSVSALEGIRARLAERGMVVSDSRNLVTRAVCLVAVTVVFCFGLCKVEVGIERDRPVALLIGLLGGFVFASLLLLRRLHRSRRGDRALERLRHEHSGARAGTSLPMTAGLFGLAGLFGGPIDALKLTLGKSSGTGAGGGVGCAGGGGCGGGGCGGGCGGCAG